MSETRRSILSLDQFCCRQRDQTSLLSVGPKMGILCKSILASQRYERFSKWISLIESIAFLCGDPIRTNTYERRSVESFLEAKPFIVISYNKHIDSVHESRFATA